MNITQGIDWIESRIENDVLILKILVSCLDSKQHPREEYRRALDAAIANGYDRIVLNLSTLESTNHTWGLLQLIFIANWKLKEVSGRLALCGFRRNARRVFRTANLDKLFALFKTEKEAVHSWAKNVTECTESSSHRANLPG